MLFSKVKHLAWLFLAGRTPACGKSLFSAAPGRLPNLSAILYNCSLGEGIHVVETIIIGSPGIIPVIIV
jgi:hypothetical protein